MIRRYGVAQPLHEARPTRRAVEPTVDRDGLTADVSSVICGQEGDNRGNLIWHTPTTERDVSLESFGEARRLPSSSPHLGDDQAGSDTVHSHPARAESSSLAPRERVQCGLRGAVGRAFGETEACSRTEVLELVLPATDEM